MTMTHLTGLRVFLVGLFLLLEVYAQNPEIGFCGTYETSKNFNEDFISEMENSETRYSFLLSTSQTGGCKKLTFYSTNIYYYQTTHLSGNPNNVSATFETQPYSASSPATITLSELPFAELGSLLGSVTFNVLKAEREMLVLLSCYNIGLIRFRCSFYKYPRRPFYMCHNIPSFLRMSHHAIISTSITTCHHFYKCHTIPPFQQVSHHTTISTNVTTCHHF
ncbi:hypothetical protein FHG87_016778 [Trinorchestia longiramus]|nr:hypothetical protein FHG87_016778 [Trinorchestia longiramus]